MRTQTYAHIIGAGSYVRLLELRLCLCLCVCVPGTLQNFGHCVVDGSGIATFSLRTTAGETLYELQLTPTNSC